MDVTVDDVAGVIVDAIDRAVAPLLTRIAVLEERNSDLRGAVARLESAAATPLAGVGDTLAVMRERLATLETRAPVPGPAGKDGRDGLDGFGFDDLDVTGDGGHGVTFTFRQADRVRTFALAVPWLVYRGVYDAGAYVPGDVVTWAGSAWICRTATGSKPGDQPDAWTLAVKRGRDGRDGKGI